MTELQDALENCLQAMERGASVETALRRYPGLAAELRPLLDAASLARDARRVYVPSSVRRRGRSQLLERAAELNQARAPRRRVIPAFPRMALTGLLAAALVLTSTGLVSASSASLPGDQLYPVKRTWESVRLLFALNPGERDLMESDFEQERLDEALELLGRRKAQAISFSGILARQANGNWIVSGIPVSITAATGLPAGTLQEGLPVTVSGTTRPDGVVEVQQVQVLQPGASLPPLEPSEKSGGEDNAPGEEGDHGSAATAAPNLDSTAAAPAATYTSYQYSGVVQSVTGNVWVINGQTVHVDAADISGQVTVGSLVRFFGYYDAQGTFVVTSIQPQKSSGGSETKSGGKATSEPHGGEGGEGGQGGGGETEGP